MPVVKEVCKEYSIPWTPTKNFLFDRLPTLYKFYLWAPMRRGGKVVDENMGVLEEAFSWTNFKYMCFFVFLGFSGAGNL